MGDGSTELDMPFGWGFEKGADGDVEVEVA